MTPPGWRSLTLGQVLRIKHGYAFKGEYFADEGPYVVLTPGNFYDEGGFKRKGDREKHYTGPVPDDFILSSGDLIVAMTEQAEGLLGSSALVPESGRYLHNQRLGLVTVLERDQAHSRFLYYLFNTRPVRSRIRASASGVKVRHTSPSRIYEIEVVIPPLPTQRKIAAILSAYDDLIENNSRRIGVLTDLARCLLRHCLGPSQLTGQLCRPRDLATAPSTTATELGRIATARRVSFSLADHRHLPLIDLSRIPRRSLEIGNPGASDELTTSRTVFEEGDVLFGAIRPYLHKVVVAPFRGVTNTSVHVVRSLGSVPQSFLACMLFSDPCVAWAQQYSGGTKMPVIPWDTFRRMPVRLPSASRLDEFDRIASPAISLVSVLNRQNALLRRARDLLVPRLMSGTLDVSDMPIAVPEEA